MRVFPSVIALIALSPMLVGAAESNAFIHSPPAEAVAGVALTIEGSLASGNYSKLLVRYKVGAAWEESELELQYGDLYRGIIPASQVAAPGVAYYIEGINSFGDRVQLLGSTGKPLKVKVTGGEGVSPEDNPYTVERPERERPAVKVEPEPVAAPVNPKCKKLKKGKKLPKECEEQPAPRREPVVEPEAEPEPRRAAVEPVKPAKEPERRAEPVEAPREEPARSTPPRETARPVKKQSELDEELALYGAEASAGIAQHVDEQARHQSQAPTILTASELRRLGVRYVYEALDLVPGLSVSRDVQGFYRVAVRGLRSDAEVLFQLDGQRLNDFYDGKALANLPIDTLARIEVYRGPAAAEVGLGNFLAVVNLVTDREDGLRVSGAAGLFSAYDGHLSAARTFGGLKVALDGDFVTQGGQTHAVLVDGLDGTLKRSKSTSDRRLLVNAGLGVSYENEALGVLSVGARFMLENRSALLGLFDVVGNDSQLSWQVLQANVAWRKPVGPHTVGLRLWFDQQSTQRLWQLAPDAFQLRPSDPATLFPDGVLEQVSAGVRSFGLEARGELALPAKNRLVATLSGEFQSVFAYEYLSNSVVSNSAYAGSLKRPDGLVYPTENGVTGGARGPAADRLGLGVSVMDTWTLIEAVSVQAGVRFDLLQLPTASAAGAWTGASLVPSVGPRLGLVVTPISSLILRGQYGRSYRAPTVQELAETIPDTPANQGRAIGNPQLQGAYIDSVEAGFEYVQAIGDGRLRLRGQGFFEHVSNAIVSIDFTGNLVPYSNRPLGEQAFGAEGEGRLELTSRTQVWLNASWVRASDLGTPATAQLLTDVPQARFNAGLSFPIGPYLAFDVRSSYASERRNNSRSVLELIRRYTLPAHATFAAQLRTELLFEHVEVAVLGQNVFNLEYADDATRPDRVTGGVPRETVTVFGTVRVVF